MPKTIIEIEGTSRAIRRATGELSRNEHIVVTCYALKAGDIALAVISDEPSEAKDLAAEGIFTVSDITIDNERMVRFLAPEIIEKAREAGFSLPLT